MNDVPPLHFSLASAWNPRKRCLSCCGPRAFSLIELLVVVSIVTLLVAMLLPALTQAREAAFATICASNQKQWGTAFYLYAEDRDDALPWFRDSYPSPDYALDWVNITAEYMNAKAMAPDGSVQILETRLEQVQKCPTGRAEVSVVYGGVNNPSHGHPPAPILYGGRSGERLPPPFTFSEVRHPATWAMLLDGLYFMYTFAHWPPDLDWDEDGIPDTYSGLQIWGKTEAMYNRGCPRTHHDALNMTMVDGHVERIDLWTYLDPTADFWHDD